MKYNDNGTIKEISVKASDTLPIGSIVEFDGDTIPSGWEEVEDNRNVYSTEETRIGGTKIYWKAGSQTTWQSVS